jgi:hypothetical protein
MSVAGGAWLRAADDLEETNSWVVLTQSKHCPFLQQSRWAFFIFFFYGDKMLCEKYWSRGSLFLWAEFCMWTTVAFFTFLFVFSYNKLHIVLFGSF